MNTAQLLIVLREGLHRLDLSEQKSAERGLSALTIDGQTFSREHIAALDDALAACQKAPSSATWLKVEYVAACTIRGIEP